MRMPLSANGRADRLVMHLTEITSPLAAMMSRLSLEPVLAGHAAIHAAPRHVSGTRRLDEGIRSTANRLECARLYSRLHELVAVVAGNPHLTELHRILNTIRVSVVWPRLELRQDGPPADNHYFAEHDANVAVIENRDRRAARPCVNARPPEICLRDASEG